MSASATLWWSPLRDKRPPQTAIVERGIELKKLTARELLIASVWTRSNWFNDLIFQMGLVDHELRAVLRAVGNWPSKWDKRRARFMYTPNTVSEGLVVADCCLVPLNPVRLLLRPLDPSDTAEKYKRLFTAAKTLPRKTCKMTDVPEFELSNVPFHRVSLFKYKIRLLRRFVQFPQCHQQNMMTLAVGSNADLAVFNRLLPCIMWAQRCVTVSRRERNPVNMMVRKKRLFQYFCQRGTTRDRDWKLFMLEYEAATRGLPWDVIVRRLGPFMEWLIESPTNSHNWEAGSGSPLYYKLMALRLAFVNRRYDVYRQWCLRLSALDPANWASMRGNLLEDIVMNNTKYWFQQLLFLLRDAVPFADFKRYFETHTASVTEIPRDFVHSHANYRIMWMALFAARPDLVLRGVPRNVIGYPDFNLQIARMRLVSSAFWATVPLNSPLYAFDDCIKAEYKYGRCGYPRDLALKTLSLQSSFEFVKLRRWVTLRLDPEHRTERFEVFTWDDWQQLPQLCDTSKENETRACRFLMSHYQEDLGKFLQAGMFRDSFIQQMMEDPHYVFRMSNLFTSEVVSHMTVEQVRRALSVEYNPRLAMEFAKLTKYKT